MRDTDPTLEAWERGQRRRSLAIGALVCVLVLMLLVMSALAVILVRRSPVIARIDESERQEKCASALSASFLAAVGQGLIERDATPERRKVLAARVQITTAALTDLSHGAEPCSIHLPPLEDL